MEVWAICLLTIGMMLSTYYAYRGYEDNWFRQRELNAEKKVAMLEELSSWDIITVYCIPDAIFHFLSSITGFFVLTVVFKMYQSLKFDDPSLDTGTSLLFALSFVFGSNVQTTAKPLPVTTAVSQSSRASVDWCCVAGLACCVPDPK